MIRLIEVCFCKVKRFFSICVQCMIVSQYFTTDDAVPGLKVVRLEAARQVYSMDWQTHTTDITLSLCLLAQPC